MVNKEKPTTSRARQRGTGVVPPEKTGAEEFYYRKQMGQRTPVVVKMTDGEEFRGWIEWYDRNCIKVNRSGHANLLIYKQSIRYMFKAGENSNGRR